MKVIEDVLEECKKCLACLRECPVKAISIDQGLANVIQEKCINCGQCVLACTQRAKVVRNDLQQLESLLSSGKVIAVLSSEFSAALHPFELGKIESALMKVGFEVVEESVLGEEMTARQLEKYLKEAKEYPVIRSTCPVIVSYIQKYSPSLVKNIAPIISPMVAQSKICKSTYPDSYVVFFGECIAQKAEAEQYQSDDGPDIVLTYWELLSFLEKKQIDLDSQNPRGLGRSVSISREFSFGGGFPRKIISESSEFSKKMIILRGREDFLRFESYLSDSQEQVALIDIMFCRGCIDGPVIRHKATLAMRKNIISQFDEQRSLDGSLLKTSQFNNYLPYIPMTTSFLAKPISSDFISSPPNSETKRVLQELGFNESADELNCEACGYSTCWEFGEAILKGFAEKEMCFPFFQKRASTISQELREVSGQDTLTTLANYARFQEILSNEFNRAKRYNSPLALIILDIDYFKLINDTYGHVKGDKVLKLVAEILRQNLREADIPFRQGGDEFAIILPEINKTEAFAVAEKIRKKIEETRFYISPKEFLEVTVSLGVGSYESSMEDKIDLIDLTDKAMYKAKKAGRNRTMVTNSYKKQ